MQGDCGIKPIKLEVARSTTELDIQGIEVDWQTARALARDGDIGNISVTNPRACTHADRGVREEIMDHTFDRLWGISPWELDGCPDERGVRTRDPIPLRRPATEGAGGAPFG